ncbi:MAG: alpha/beta hydrolase [Saprospiraceae bacterium]
MLLLLFFWLVGNLFTFLWQDYFIFRPQKLPQQYAYQFEQHFTEIFLDAPQGGKLNALWFKQLNAKGVILFFHGNAGSLQRWGHLHHFFQRLGYDYFVYDYRGYGKSTGKRSEHLMYEDALLMFEFIRQHYPENQIVVFGRSMGSAFASRVAVAGGVKMLILETPFYSMRNLFYSYYPFLPPVFLFKYPFFNHRYLRQVQCPIYIFQGTKDWVVPYKCAARLQKWLKPGDAFITIPGGGHNNLLFYDIYNRKLQEILGGHSERKN